MTIRDGLGGEEVNQTDDIQTEYVYGTTISGTTVYGTTVNATTVNSTYVSGAGNTIYGQVMVAQNLYIDVAASGAAFHERTKGALHSVGIGSGTTTYGATILAGSTALGAGSNVWEVFSTVFSSGTHPIVTVSNMTSTGGLMVGSLQAGSFYVEGVNASDEFSFIAIGL